MVSRAARLAIATLVGVLVFLAGAPAQAADVAGPAYVAEASVPAVLVPVPAFVPPPPAPEPEPEVIVAAAPVSDRWVWPVDGRRINQAFRPPAHHGVDLDAELDDPVYAARAGTILDILEDDVYGLHVLVEHPDGLVTLYAHLSRTLVLPGRPVAAGEILGRVGMTGRTTGAHVHFEVRREGRAIDPLPYLLGDE